MRQITAKLCRKYGLRLRLFKRRMVMFLAKNKALAGFFRPVFEHPAFKKIIGINITLVFAVTALFPNQIEVIEQFEPKQDIIDTEIVLPAEKDIRYPVNTVTITQNYKFYHPGIDFDGDTGDPIHPIINGVVIAIDRSYYAYGNAILIDHGNGITSLYAHLSKIEVEPDQFVSAPMVIGQMGSTGRSSGSHLHLEIRKNGLPINPLSLLPKNGN